MVVLVVISHASYYSIITNYGGIYYGKEMIAQGVSDTFFHRISMNITLLIYGFHMPAFIVLSGYLFGKQLQSGRFMDVKELFLNKFKRLILPLLFVWFCWNVPIKYISGYYDGYNVLRSSIVQLVNPDHVYLWYVEALFFSYFIVYYVKKITNGRIQFLVCFGFWIIGIAIRQAGYQFLGNPALYALWLWLGTNFDKIWERKTNDLVLTIVYFLSWLLCKRYAILWIINDTVLPVIGIKLLHDTCSAIYKRTKNQKITEYLSTYAFGIYLYAEPLNYLFLFLFVNTFGISAFGSEIGAMSLYLSRLIITPFISIILCIILRKIKFLIAAY